MNYNEPIKTRKEKDDEKRDYAKSLIGKIPIASLSQVILFLEGASISADTDKADYYNLR